MTRKEEFEYKIFDNYIEIIPKEGVKNNSIYNIKVKGLKAINKTKYLDPINIEICTPLLPAYCSLEAVTSLVEDFEIEDKKLLYFIREASKYVEYIKNESYEYDKVPFEATQYTKYKAAHDSLLKFYISFSSEGGTSGTIGEITFNNTNDLPSIKDLLNVFKEEVYKWEQALRGKCRPTSAVKGVNLNPGTQYGTFLTGYSRGVSRK